MVWWWFGANMAGQRNKMLLNSFFKSSYYHKNKYWVLRKWFGVVWMWFGVFPRTRSALIRFGLTDFTSHMLVIYAVYSPIRAC